MTRQQASLTATIGKKQTDGKGEIDGEKHKGGRVHDKLA